MTDQQQPHPNIPTWATQPQQPSGWGPAPEPPKKKHLARNIVLGVVGAVVLIGIIGAATGSGGKKDDDKSTAAAPSATATTEQPADAPGTEAAAPATTATKPAPKPKPKAKTVLTESGDGIKTTVKFHVSGDWDLHYTYDCSNFGTSGNFIVTTGGTDFPMPLANELGANGSEVTHQHDGGTLYLEVNSECSWTVKVVDIP